MYGCKVDTVEESFVLRKDKIFRLRRPTAGEVEESTVHSSQRQRSNKVLSMVYAPSIKTVRVKRYIHTIYVDIVDCPTIGFSAQTLSKC